MIRTCRKHMRSTASQEHVDILFKPKSGSLCLMIFEGLSIFGGPTEINSSQAFEMTLMHIEHEGGCSLSLE